MTDLVIEQREPGFVIGHAGNIVFAYYDTELTETVLRAVREANDRLAATYPKGIGYLGLIQGGKPRFSEPVREEAKRVFAETAAYTIASAHVLLTRGLLAAAIRSFISGILLVTPNAAPEKIFKDVDEAIDWLVPNLNARGEVQWTREVIQGHAAELIPA